MADAEGRVGWGVLSAGHIASTFAGDLALLTDQAALVAVSSRDVDRAQVFADRHGFARAYGSAEELAADPDVDVVYVASIHNDHLRSASLCLKAEQMLIFRGADPEPEQLVTQWPGAGYTFEAQEVMRCLRSGERESPLVPWADTLAVAHVLDRWRALIR